MAGLGSLLGAWPAPGEPDVRRRRASPERRRPRHLAGPGHPCTTPRPPNRFHLVRALTGLSHTGRAGRANLFPCITCTLLHLDSELSHAALLIFACASPRDFFSPVAVVPPQHPCPHPVSWRSDPGRKRVSELVLAISGRPCGPAHSASHHGAPRVISPRPGPAGPGLLDAGRRDLVGHGRLEEGGMRGT